MYLQKARAWERRPVPRKMMISSLREDGVPGKMEGDEERASSKTGRGGARKNSGVDIKHRDMKGYQLYSDCPALSQ